VIYEYRDRFSDRFITASARHNGIQIRAVGQQAIDTTSPAGRMMLQMLGSFAEFERAMLRERTKVGLESARRQGRIGGRRPKLRPQQQAEIIKMVSRGRRTGRCCTPFRRASGDCLSPLSASSLDGKLIGRKACRVEKSFRPHSAKNYW
jgi:hypothetical protein